MLVESELAIFGFEVVDVNGAIGRLGGDELVQGIPCYTLDVVVVLRNLSNHLAYNG